MKTIKVGTYSKAEKSLKIAEHEPEERGERRVDRHTGLGDKPAVKKKSLFRKIFRKKVIIPLVILLVIIGGAIAASMRLQEINSRVETYDEQGNRVTCSDILNPSCWTNAFKPQLKQTDGFSNVLILGVDTRPGTSSLSNTDTIMIASFDHATQKTMLISIPRDFFDYTYKTKINAVWAWTAKKNPDDTFFYLKQELQKITGLTIHYVVLSHFEGVIDAINNLGGIQVCPADSFIAMYPNDKAKPWDRDQWLYYPFDKGCQQVDGQKALVYARFRHLKKGPAYLASDFSRNRRQQEVISAAKDKLLSLNMSIGDLYAKYTSLAQTFKDSINMYGVQPEDILAGLSFMDTADRVPIGVVADPTLGGGFNKLIYTPPQSGYGYIIEAKDSSYKGIQAEIANIRKYADFYRDQPRIVVRNQTGAKSLPKDSPALAVEKQMQYYQIFDVFNDKKSTTLTGTHIFDFSAGKKANTIAFLQKYLGVDKVEDTPETYGISRSNKNEDILIVVGPDAPTATPTPTGTPTPSP